MFQAHCVKRLANFVHRVTNTRQRWWWAAGALLLLGFVVYLALPYFLRTGDAEPPLNTVVISDRLTTSGQPSVAQLRRLQAQGYTVVVNLAPPDSYGSIAGEAQVVEQQGMHYVGLPVRWEQPDPEDLEQFRRVLDTWRGHRIWVHCQMNMRASVFVLLRRVIDERVTLDRALEAVHAVWVPNATWARYITTELARHGVVVDPDQLR